MMAFYGVGREAATHPSSIFMCVRMFTLVLAGGHHLSVREGRRSERLNALSWEMMKKSSSFNAVFKR